MRLDHGYRVKDRQKTADFFQKCFGYKVGTEFRIKFEDGNSAECALAPPETEATELKIGSQKLFQATTTGLVTPFTTLTANFMRHLKFL